MNAIACAIIFAAILLRLPRANSIDDDDKASMFFTIAGVFIMAFAFFGSIIFMVSP